MPVRQYANAPATTLSASATATDASISVTAVTGLPITYPYTLIIDRGTSTEEAVEVTAASDLVLTVTRGIDATTAFAHANGATVAHGITARDVKEPNAHINASTDVHGVAGAVVGTTDTQTLANKNLTAASNSFPTSLVTLTGAQTLTDKTLTAPIATGSLAGFGGARSTWTPTFTNAGAALAHTVNSARFSQVGKEVVGQIDVTLNAAGAGPLRFDLPVTALSSNLLIGFARESAAAGTMWQVVLNTTTTAQLFRYDNASDLLVNDRFLITFTYEAA